MNVAILDDYQNVALRIADWSGVRRCNREITVFNDHVADPRTPHIGYVTEDLYRTFYADAAANVATWLEANAAVR
jgi:hypothetical protein